MNAPLSLILGALASSGLVVGAMVAGILGQPGATLRQIQSLKIDASMGAPTYIQTRTGPLATWDMGPETGETFVFVHGFGDAGAGWTDAAVPLTTLHRVVVVDLPGHGRSAPRGDTLAFDELRDGLAAVIAREDQPVVLVGNSLGGWLSALHAIDDPKSVKHLVLVNNAGMKHAVDPDLLMPSTPEQLDAKVHAVMGDEAPELRGFLADAMIELQTHPRYRDLYEETQRGAPYLDGRLQGLETPVTVVWGTPDPFFPREGYLDRLLTDLPGTPEPVFLDGCAHAPQYSCPDELAGALFDIVNAAP